MTKINKIIFIFTLAFCFSLSCFAQNKPAWITLLEDNLKQKEAQWKIEKADGVTSQNGAYDYVFILKSGESKTSIQVTKSPDVSDLEECAMQGMFADGVALFSKNMGKSVEKVKLENFGDEGFIWTNLNKDNSTMTMIKFRKKDIFVSVYATSEKAARDFAGYVVEQMP
jgi:hypothetical protein